MHIGLRLGGATRSACAVMGLTLAPQVPSLGAQMPHPFSVAQPATAPEEFLALIEIPQGSFTKYEIDPASGHVMVDRFQSMAVRYPANYGAVPSSLGDDGDALDVLVLTREPIVPGALIRVRPIGMLNMVDGGEGDEKIIAVPTSAVDPHYDAFRDIDDLAVIERQAIEEFFNVYKNLPKGRKAVVTSGFGNRDAAMTLLRSAIRAHSNPSTPDADGTAR